MPRLIKHILLNVIIALFLQLLTDRPIELGETFYNLVIYLTLLVFLTQQVDDALGGISVENTLGYNELKVICEHDTMLTVE